ncbi:DUF2946 family protein [Sphingomonas sp. PB4P5]|uniref:DUF2946 family protein n=1 Tax=Parasphingomonas puruogangriensis TaxID=3096155 RepID=UPI002FC6EF23
MTSLRHHLRDHRLLAMWLIAAALLMKVIVPAGFMPIVSANGITIELCSGFAPTKMVMAMPGMTHHQDKPAQGKDLPCAFSGLSTPSMAATDPLLLAIALAFILATVFRVMASARVSLPAFLRPPLRGPPVSLTS